MALDHGPLGKRHDLICAPGSPLEQVLSTCDRVAKTDTTVLLTGETGTGKEVIARHLHRVATDAASGDARQTTGAFIPVNCGAIPENLIEAELFGHARGAFTGAHTSRKGRVAMAEGGTLFLDEIGELPLSLQVKLLRLLQERTYEPVGDSKSVKANFRLIAATNRDLAGEVVPGVFAKTSTTAFTCVRSNSRLSELAPTTSSSCWRIFGSRRGESRMFSEDAMRKLTQYPWPGNVRELENLVERLSVCATGAIIEAADLPALYSLSNVDIEMSGPIPPAPGPAPLFHSQPEPPNTFLPAAPAPMVPAFPAAPPQAMTSGEGWPVTDVPLPWLNSAGSAPQGRVQTPDAQPVPPQAAESHPGPSLPNVVKDDPIDLPALLRSLEWAYIETALEQTGGNKQTAAKLLGLRRTTLVEKLRRRQKADQSDVAAAASH